MRRRSSTPVRNCAPVRASRAARTRSIRSSCEPAQPTVPRPCGRVGSGHRGVRCRSPGPPLHQQREFLVALDIHRVERLLQARTPAPWPEDVAVEGDAHVLGGRHRRPRQPHSSQQLRHHVTGERILAQILLSHPVHKDDLGHRRSPAPRPNGPSPYPRCSAAPRPRFGPAGGRKVPPGPRRPRPAADFSSLSHAAHIAPSPAVFSVSAGSSPCRGLPGRTPSSDTGP